ncbi:MAG TPA: DUF2109 family protein [Methanocorpusculum sp.]|nr:DUF2109 domain-containing protein [Methanocorpusculum sp.]MBO5432374.1 DUF2109 domain-containing protein [Methanocorpusculum sp.]MBP3444035.1 DUF2109 domain-containing protein [Methanocorpusculaceae archaeon]HJJ63761.1 DUF2109 family protein [Methanocorpusculum sp.]HJJ72452.1 DUF2109 family protein [Methanocorpusculum sp.]
MIVETICALAAVYAVIRIIFEKSTLKKLAYLNVLGFAVAGAIVLLLPHPITIGAAVAYFVGATLESNAIASTLAVGGEE